MESPNSVHIAVRSLSKRVMIALFLSIIAVGELSYFFEVRSSFFSFTQSTQSVEKFNTDYRPIFEETLSPNGAKNLTLKQKLNSNKTDRYHMPKLKTDLSSSGASSRAQNLTLEPPLSSNQTERDHWPQLKKSLHSSGAQNLTLEPTLNSNQTPQVEIKPSPSGAQNLKLEPTSSALKFEREQWPRLQRKLCPSGVPNLSFGPILFKLGRKELGISEKAIFPKLDKAHKLKSNDFFDDMYELSLFIDGHDQDNSFLYPSIWKCGNNQVHSYIELVTNRNADGTMKDKNSSAFGHKNDTIAWRLNRKQFQKLLPQYGWGDFHEKPCIFTTIRDPIGRVISGYNEVEYRMTTGSQMAISSKEMLQPPYLQIPPYSLHNKERKASKQDLEKRFRQFVANLVREHPSITKTNTVYRHIHPMSKILPTLKRLNLLPTDGSWLLALDSNITETFPKFLNERCPRLANIYHAKKSTQNELANGPEEFPGFPDMPVDGQHVSSTDPFGTYGAANSVIEMAGPTTRALCSVYAFDYACFYKASSPFKAADIPDICREVYASDVFQNEILLQPVT